MSTFEVSLRDIKHAVLSNFDFAFNQHWFGLFKKVCNFSIFGSISAIVFNTEWSHNPCNLRKNPPKNQIFFVQFQCSRTVTVWTYIFWYTIYHSTLKSPKGIANWAFISHIFYAILRSSFLTNSVKLKKNLFCVLICNFWFRQDTEMCSTLKQLSEPKWLDIFYIILL